MDFAEEGTIMNGRPLYRKRRRTLISCTECHRRKQKCDRVRPCQNCVARGKPAICNYERNGGKMNSSTAASAVSASSAESGENPSRPCDHALSLSKTNQLSPQDHRHLVGILGYSNHNAHNTFSLVNKVGATASRTLSPPFSTDNSTAKQKAIDDRYRSLLRQLPSTEYVDILIQQFFSEINWQYDVIDETTFRQQLGDWRRLPYSVHSQACLSLPADILAFPSLVFQLMAHSLIHQPPSEQATSSLESLKYASGMTFLDLARDFSEAGYSMIQMMEKKDLSLVAVQSGILRASFLKNVGSVVEAWHIVGATIRDAQEIGLHADVTVKHPSVSIDAQWDHEMRRRVWFVLHNWDIHMAVVLGRPILITTPAEVVDLPDDIAYRESGKPPRRRMEEDSPTPSSVIRVGYDTAYRYFPLVREIENRGGHIKDYNIVRETHAAIVRNMDRIPLWCRHDNPDTYFDGIPNGHWLPAARLSLMTGMQFVLLTLHRLYVFSVHESRTEVLKAAIAIFTAQKQLFHLSEPRQYISFNLVYPLFDTMVISLAIVVLFPNENHDFHSQLVENVVWGISILAEIGQYNVMARSARDIVKALLSRLENDCDYSLQHLNHNSEERTSQAAGFETADLCAPERISDTSVAADAFDATNLGGGPSFLSRPVHPTGLSYPNSDVATLPPPRPIGDLFYQDISVTLPEALRGLDFQMDFPQFDGNYSDDSFWSFMNDFNHA